MRVLAVISVLLWPNIGAAQQVMECDWQASARSIVEPWDRNTRTFANSSVRLAVLDTIEPAGGSTYMLVLSPPYQELGQRQCKLIGADGVVGFTHLEFSSLNAKYEPAVGLQFAIDGSIYDHETGVSQKGVLSFTLNQSTGEIGSQFELDAQ